MATNAVAIRGDSGSLSVQAIPLGGAPTLEFRSGSFRASAPERRVCGVFLFAPTGNKQFEVRFEFTDPSYAVEDIKGQPVRIEDSTNVPPFGEPRVERPMDEGR